MVYIDTVSFLEMIRTVCRGNGKCSDKKRPDREPHYPRVEGRKEPHGSRLGSSSAEMTISVRMKRLCGLPRAQFKRPHETDNHAIGEGIGRVRLKPLLTEAIK